MLMAARYHPCCKWPPAFTNAYACSGGHEQLSQAALTLATVQRCATLQNANQLLYLLLHLHFTAKTVNTPQKAYKVALQELYMQPQLLSGSLLDSFK
jgi:hypothetical protein